MNRSRSSGHPNGEREHDPQRARDFHAVLLGMPGHDLRQPLQVVQSTYERLGSASYADNGKANCDEANSCGKVRLRSENEPTNSIA
jgi:hypothetical protein